MIAILLNSIFVAYTYSQPIAMVFFDLELNCCWAVTFFLYGRFHESKVIVVGFSRFDGIFTDNFDTMVLEFGAEFELDGGIEDAGVVDGFLERSHERGHDFFDGDGFILEIFL